MMKRGSYRSDRYNSPVPNIDLIVVKLTLKVGIFWSQSETFKSPREKTHESEVDRRY